MREKQSGTGKEYTGVNIRSALCSIVHKRKVKETFREDTRFSLSSFPKSVKKKSREGRRHRHSTNSTLPTLPQCEARGRQDTKTQGGRLFEELERKEKA